MNFDYALNEFRRYLWQNYSNNTKQKYRKNTIKSYLQAIKMTLSKKNLDTLTQKDLDDISVDLLENYKIGGNRLRHSAINLFCKEILKREDLHLKIPKSKPNKTDILTNGQVEKILKVARNKRKVIYAVFQTLYDCALRVSEVYNLDVDDVNFEAMEIRLRETKTDEGIPVTMTSRVADVIRDYCLYGRKPKDHAEPALFLNRCGERIGEHFVRGHLKECAVEAGIIRRVYPHLLRASCITHLLNERVNPYTVQIHARHRDFKTTMIYNRPTQQQMRQDIERIFVRKDKMTDEDRERAIFDRYLKGDITVNELRHFLGVTRPKELKQESELTGYS